MQENKYSWVGFCQEFATKLSEFKDDRKTLIDKIIHAFQSISMSLPKLTENDIPEDIDPFTVVGLFNKGIADEKRIRIIRAFKEEFGINAPVPHAFEGVPRLNPQNSTIYAFGEDKQNTIQDLWTVFLAALKLVDLDRDENRDAFASAFDKALRNKNVSWILMNVGSCQK